jgi:uncharacterized membrane-anchored protein YitT (DUF2179 family)
MKRIYSYLLIHLGILLVTAGIVLFKIPNNFATGGVTGISLVINRLFPSLSIGFLMLSLNIILIIAGLLFTDFEFEKRTIYSTIVLSLLVWYFQNAYPIRTPLTGDTMLELIAAIILLAAGSALLFYQNASGGGTDIIAKIINLRTHLHIGKTVLISDLVISILALSVFGIKIGIYSIIGVIIKGFLIDAIIEGLHGSKQVFIISSKTPTIKKFIMENIGRGVTVYSAIGGHTNTEKEVLNTIMSRKETIKLKDYVKLIDKEAFVVVGNVSEIMGSGFNKL